MHEQAISLLDLEAELFAETTFWGCFFTLFGTIQNEAPTVLRLFPWLILTLLCGAVFYRFTAKERALSSLLLLGGLLFAAETALMLLFFSALPGLTTILLAALFLLVPPVRAGLLCVSKPNPDGSIKQIECSALATEFLLMLQMGDVKLPPFYNLCMLLSVLLGFLRAVRARVGGTKSGTVTFSRARGVILLGAGGIMLLAVIGVFAAFEFSLRGGLQAVVDALLSAAVATGGALWSLLLFLFSLLPKIEDGGLPPSSPPLPGLPQGEAQMAVSNVPVWVLVAGILAACALVYLLLFFLLRKARITVRRSGRDNRRVTVQKEPLTSAFRRWMRRLERRIRFFWNSLHYRNTPQGTLVFLERWGAAQRMARLQGETHRCYLERLGRDAAQLQNQQALLEELADLLDWFYYAPSGRKKQLWAEKARALRRSCQARRGD